MKNLLFFLIFNLIIWLFIPKNVNAIENPLSVSNNKFGIHILFPEELTEAASLVNSNSGDWGYITIPIQALDRDLIKWQKFMDDAKKHHIIPLVRLSTEGDYFNTKVWRRPREADILDFANFLNSLNWPTKNRYIIVFNEVNRYDEWGESPDPGAYAELLSYAITTFKSKNQNFFIIQAGLDNASADVPGLSLNEYTYFRKMNEAVPGIFSRIDGLASHSYPNPGFFQSPFRSNSESVVSFRFEKELFKSFGANSDLPVFITETGWSKNALSDDIISVYYKEVFDSAWNSSDIVAITPFLLRAGSGPFTDFSFINSDGSKTHQYNVIKEITKTKGQPALADAPLKNEPTISPSSMPTRKFSEQKASENMKIEIPLGLKVFVRYLLKI